MLHKEVLRPSKVYYMLANRACRMSIMIGDDLKYDKMKEIVTNLSSL